MPKNQSQLNPYNQPLDSPIARPNVPPRYIPWQFGRTQGYQGRQVKVSKLNVKKPFQLSALATSQGTCGNGNTLDIVTTLTPNAPHANEINFGDPYIGIYQGTAANSDFQIYPAIGGSITPGQYLVYGGLDFQLFAGTQPGSIISAWSGYLTNVSAGNQTILLVTQWKFINMNSGSVTG